MPDVASRKRAPRREERVSRTYRLPLSKLRAAKRALGAATATETIERALDLAVFQRGSSTERGRCSGSRSCAQTLNGDSSVAQVPSRHSTLHQRLSRSG